jgi:hypothetical protein
MKSLGVREVMLFEFAVGADEESEAAVELALAVAGEAMSATLSGEMVMFAPRSGCR